MTVEIATLAKPWKERKMSTSSENQPTRSVRDHEETIIRLEAFPSMDAIIEAEQDGTITHETALRMVDELYPLTFLQRVGDVVRDVFFPAP